MIAVHLAKRLDFGNQMATFPHVATLDLNLDQLLSPHGSPIPLAAVPFLRISFFT